LPAAATTQPRCWILSRPISRCCVSSFMNRSPGRATPPGQLLGAQLMAPRNLRHADAAHEALLHDAGPVLARPSPAAPSTHGPFDPPHVRDAAATPVRLAVKCNVKIIAHGSALRHNPDRTETWERNPAYVDRGRPEGPAHDQSDAIDPKRTMLISSNGSRRPDEPPTRRAHNLRGYGE
jgi:hypothetical protein